MASQLTLNFSNIGEQIASAVKASLKDAQKEIKTAAELDISGMREQILGKSPANLASALRYCVADHSTANARVLWPASGIAGTIGNDDRPFGTTLPPLFEVAVLGRSGHYVATLTWASAHNTEQAVFAVGSRANSVHGAIKNLLDVMTVRLAENERAVLISETGDSLLFNC